MTYIVGGLASFSGPLATCVKPTEDPNLPDYHGMMAFFCEEEAKLFQSRAEACWLGRKTALRGTSPAKTRGPQAVSLPQRSASSRLVA